MIARGVVLGVHGGLARARIPCARFGDVVRLGARPFVVSGEICSVDGECVLIAVHGSVDGIARGTPVVYDPAAARAVLGCAALGRALDAHGRPIDGGLPLTGRRALVSVQPPLPHERVESAEPQWTGLRAIDGLLTLARGARIGVFGAPGAGKSTLLENVVAWSSAEAVVVGLVGERGREARRWIDARPKHATIVCATSDRPATERARAAMLAAAAAASLRERGLHVLFVLDSLARVAAAWREIFVAAGESVGRGGYPPRVFAELARLVEVAGITRSGSITLVATVLSDGDERDPVSDAARSLLDGHIVLSAPLAQAGRFPAIDPLLSASRTMSAVASPAHVRAAACVRGALALLERSADARRVGIEPVDDLARRAIDAEPRIETFLRQVDRPASPVETFAALTQLADSIEPPPR